MNLHPTLDLGMKILHARLQKTPAVTSYGYQIETPPFLTLSRETGAGAAALGQHLVALLDQEAGDLTNRWVLFDKDLLDYALMKNQLPARLAEFLPEDRVSEITATIGELVGLHPSLWELEHKVMEAILQLAHLGRVILIGRAANLITRSLPGGLHVRLVAPLNARIRRVMETMPCDETDAATHIRESDHARQRYVKTNFGQEISDPHAYDLVINTERIPPEQAARLVMEAMRERGNPLPLSHALSWSGWPEGTESPGSRDPFF